MPGGHAVPFHAEYKDDDTVTRERKGENVMKSGSITVDIEAASTAERAAPGPGAVKVSFWRVETYSQSGKDEYVVLEQVWAPGKPWWSSLRIHDTPDDQEGTELTTIW